MRLSAIAVLLVSLAFAACGDDDGDSNAGTAPATGAEGAAETPQGTGSSGDADSRDGTKGKASGTLIETSDSEFGSILFDGERQAVYLFDKEASEESECYGACAEAWPPVLTSGDPQAGSGIDTKLLGTTERDDGTTQVTYGGHPLYYYVEDPPGEVLCHNVEEFGGLWLVVTPSGAPVQ